MITAQAAPHHTNAPDTPCNAAAPATASLLVGAPPFEHFWVFAARLTNIEVRLTVTDTVTGASKTCVNPQNTAFQPIQDTSALNCQAR